MSTITVLIVLCSTVYIHTASVKRSKGDKEEKPIADFGERYDFDDYDVVYKLSQNKPFNIRTTGEDQHLRVMKPDSSSLLFQAPLKLPGKHPCMDFLDKLEILVGGYFSRRRDGKLIVTPGDENCLDYFDMLDSIETDKNSAYEAYHPRYKRRKARSRGFMKKLATLTNRKI